MNKKVASPLILKLAAVGGWQVQFRIEQDKRTNGMTVATELLLNGRHATEREAGAWQEILPVFHAMVAQKAASLAGEQKLATKMAGWLEQYQKATSMRRSRKPSPEREEGIRFYKSWRRYIIAAQESGQTIPDSDQIKGLSPLLAAFRTLNTEFVAGVVESMQIQWSRIYSSKDGSGEYLDRWLLDYRLKVRPKQHTVRELNQQFVLKFCSITDKKLREKCHKFDVELKPDVRGAGAVRRKRSNVPTLRSKKG
jgi:hypothetical protein